MPFKTNYANGKVYLIVSKIDRNVKYVGSTCDSLSNRLCQHKSASKLDKNKNRKIYEYFNENSWDNAEISLLELVNCKSKMELLKRERFWKDQEKPSLNINNPYISEEEKKQQMKQYYEQHVEETKQRMKKWYESHAGEVKQQSKKWYEQHADIKKQYYEQHANKIKEQTKQYREQHLNKIKQRMKKWYEKNKEQINQKIVCQCCNMKLTKSYLKTHLKTSCKIIPFRSKYMF